MFFLKKFAFENSQVMEDKDNLQGSLEQDLKKLKKRLKSEKEALSKVLNSLKNNSLVSAENLKIEIRSDSNEEQGKEPFQDNLHEEIVHKKT